MDQTESHRTTCFYKACLCVDAKEAGLIRTLKDCRDKLAIAMQKDLKCPVLEEK